MPGANAKYTCVCPWCLISWREQQQLDADSQVMTCEQLEEFRHLLAQLKQRHLRLAEKQKSMILRTAFPPIVKLSCIFSSAEKKTYHQDLNNNVLLNYRKLDNGLSNAFIRVNRKNIAQRTLFNQKTASVRKPTSHVDSAFS